MRPVIKPAWNLAGSSWETQFEWRKKLGWRISDRREELSLLYTQTQAPVALAPYCHLVAQLELWAHHPGDWGSGPAQGSSHLIPQQHSLWDLPCVTWSQLPCSLTPRAVDMLGTFSFIYI